MTTSLTAPGPRYVSGDASTGRIVLTREDDTTDEAPFWMFTGISITDNGDGTATVNFD